MWLSVRVTDGGVVKGHSLVASRAVAVRLLVSSHDALVDDRGLFEWGVEDLLVRGNLGLSGVRNHLDSWSVQRSQSELGHLAVGLPLHTVLGAEHSVLDLKYGLDSAVDSLASTPVAEHQSEREDNEEGNYLETAASLPVVEASAVLLVSMLSGMSSVVASPVMTVVGQSGRLKRSRLVGAERGRIHAGSRLDELRGEVHLLLSFDGLDSLVIFDLRNGNGQKNRFRSSRLRSLLGLDGWGWNLGLGVGFSAVTSFSAFIMVPGTTVMVPGASMMVSGTTVMVPEALAVTPEALSAARVSLLAMVRSL